MIDAAPRTPRPYRPPKSETPCLVVEGVTKSFGGLHAVRGVSFDVPEGLVTGIIGANGAGKSTLLNLISGVLKPDAGSVVFRGEAITRLSADRITRLGIARTFQDLRLFPTLTVAENILVAFPEYRRPGMLASIIGRRRLADDVAVRLAEILEFLGLLHDADRVVTEVSYGEQKLVALGRVLAAQAELILLDEPLSGLSESMIDRSLGLLDDLVQGGRTILIIDHNVEALMSFVDRVVVLDFGEKIADDVPAEVAQSDAVQRAYLGE
jgi:ABC-type branched-subunit amino acid transport system ATPase component